MNLRRTFRKAIKSATYGLATVETYRNGFCTVRMAVSGQRLVNLSVAGGDVQVGQKVIVDWSAGVPPYVHPITFTPDQLAAAYSEKKEVSTYIPKDSPPTPEILDVGVAVYRTDPGFGYTYVDNAVESVISWKYNMIPWPEFAELWDSYGLYDHMVQGGQDSISITVPGVWLIWATHNWILGFGYYDTDVALNDHIRVTIKKNGVPIAWNNFNPSIYHAGNVTTLAKLNSGDSISLHIYQDMMYMRYPSEWPPEALNKWMIQSDGLDQYCDLDLRLQLVPGTQE